jgi:glyoxylase I family protein
MSENGSIEVLGLDHVVLCSATPDVLVAFYRGIFGCEVERVVGDFLWQLRIGDSLLDIIKGDRTGANMDHFCLRVANFDEGEILATLAEHGVEGQSAGEIYGAQGFGPSIYLVDPEGNRVELKRAI